VAQACAFGFGRKKRVVDGVSDWAAIPYFDRFRCRDRWIAIEIVVGACPEKTTGTFDAFLNVRNSSN